MSFGANQASDCTNRQPPSYSMDLPGKIPAHPMHCSAAAPRAHQPFPAPWGFLPGLPLLREAPPMHP
jgi:hypothetical protein